MILAIRYTVKGVKKGYKKYQTHQLDKVEGAKGTLPDLADPSRELDTGCQAERERTNSSLDSRRRSNSDSTLIAEQALENDPEFRRYMDKHRNLYLQQQQGLPPTYDAALADGRTDALNTSISRHSQPVSITDDGERCNCHNCIAVRQSLSPSSTSSSCIAGVSELPDSTRRPAELAAPRIETNNNSQVIFTSPSNFNKDDTMLFEMPGDLPAILPEKMAHMPSELSATPV